MQQTNKLYEFLSKHPVLNTYHLDINKINVFTTRYTASMGGNKQLVWNNSLSFHKISIYLEVSYIVYCLNGMFL
jgi:hypothetical protein